jgi:hypothetical protein
MDAGSFDRLTRRLVVPTSRRTALGALAASGLLDALGIGRAAPVARAQVDCVLAFVATVRQGPSAGLPLTENGTRPGELRGELSFALTDSGMLQDGALTLPDGISLPVVGQATGHSLQVRIELAPRVALVAIGVGEEEIAACRGAVDGLATGPDLGDLGDWHAAPLRGGDNGVAQDASARAERRRNRANRGGSTGPTGPTGAGPGAASCAAGLTRCGGDCVDLAVDRQHCGACGQICPDLGGLVCQGGRCGCPAGWTDCGQAPGAPAGIEGYCADLAGDTRNCGACGAACAAGESCVNGRCQAPGAARAQCAPGLTDCDGACVDLASNLSHCGACGSPCESGLVPVECRNGVCERANCPPDQAYCGAVDGCRDLSTDPDHCGACQTPCNGSLCADGRCQSSAALCPPGQFDCNGVCFDLATDPEHCGECGVACAEGQDCVEGSCVDPQSGCQAGHADCGEGCTDLADNESHCGACGNACADGQSCRGGECVPADDAPAQAQITCAAVGLADCGGTCVDLQTDTSHCGFCGNACGDGAACVGGGCSDDFPCTGGKKLCYPACVDVLTDPTNCGACGTTCGGGQCQGGQCIPEVEQANSARVSCVVAGLADCGGACVDLQSDGLNCGTCGVECAYGEVCSGGACQSSCAAGLSFCNGVCVDTATDASHCGFCNNACAGFSQCIAGGCISTGIEQAGTGLGCDAGLNFCGGVCVDLLSDNVNCGTCGQACPYGWMCEGGSCRAICGGQGLTFCNGECVNTLVQDEHCGGCGNACEPGLFCDGNGNCIS